MFFLCVAAPENISMFYKEGAAASEKIPMCDCFRKNIKKKCAVIFSKPACNAL